MLWNMGRRRFYYKGKRVSKGEREIARYLESLGIEFIREKKFDGLVGRSNRPLRFDFYIESINVIIEYDGEHHFAPINKGWKAKYAHERTAINDKIKNNYLNEQGIGILRIPYKEFNQIKEIISDMLSNFNIITEST